MAQLQKPRQKSIKVKDIAKQYTDINRLSTHILNEEDNTVIKYYKVFDNKKIENLMKQLYASLQFDKENNINFFNDDENFIQYVLFLILKVFTNLDSEIPENLDEQIPIFNQVIGIGLFEEMFNDVFPSEQVSIVLERVGNFAGLAHQVAELEAKTRQEALQVVQHPLMKKKLEEGIANA